MEVGRRKRQDPAFHNLKRVDNQCVSYDIELLITNLDGSANEYRRDFRSHGQAFKQTIHFESVARKQKLFTCQCVVEMHSSPEALSLPRLD
jgi:hypothetical protein